MHKTKFIKAGLTLFFFWLFVGNYTFVRANQTPVLINERVFLNTDRKVYIAGENLLYNLYLIDIKENKLATYPSICYVVLKAKSGTVIGKSQVKIKDGKAVGAIYLSDTLHSGYYHIIAYTNFMRNGTSDIFYKSQILIANRFDKDFFDLITYQNADSSTSGMAEISQTEKKHLSIINDKNIYAKREKAGFKINIDGKDVNFINLSVSVVEKNLIEEQMAAQGKFVRNARAVFFEVNEKDDNPIYLAEDKSAELSGKVTNEAGLPLKNQVLYLSSPDTVNNFKYTVTNSSGYFRFPLSDYYNGKDLFIKCKQNDGESLVPKIEVNSKFRIDGNFSFQPWRIDSSVISYLKRSQDIVRVQKSFSLIQIQHKPKLYTAPVPYLFRSPDYTVKPSDFVELRDFVEIAREILPPMKIRKRDQLYYAEILDLQKRIFMPPKPLIFFDGVLIDDINQIIPFGTRDIKKVDVISSQWIIDHQALEGVLSVNSHNNLWKNLALNNNNLRVKAENYFELPNLYHPNYTLTDPASREPDFRQLLYWNPDYRLMAGNSGRIEFFTSDYATNYLIKVSGVSDKGEVIEAYSEFEVKEKI